jgi:serine/threonine-protein kinase
VDRPLPASIGRYEIIDRLGEGGMGVLYLARDPMLQRTVAIKIISGYNDELRERFTREGRSAAALKHNNIVTIYDVGDDSGRPFIAMEYLDGETMAELIRRRAPLQLSRKLQLMLELCSGLGYAHRLGIIHRDIKPANLMITSEGVLKILDFGLARLAQEGAGMGLTRAGSLLGTPHYMSPEQIEARPVDHRSDIFSVGLVLYELLTYRKAYQGDAPHAVLHRITHEAPQPIRELFPSIDPVLESIVAKAIERQPEHRYQSLETLAADCARYLKKSSEAGDGEATVQLERPRPQSQEQSRQSSHASDGMPTPVKTPRIQHLDAITRRRAAQIELHLDEGFKHFRDKRYEAAIEQCEAAAMLDPTETRALDLLERVHRAVEDTQVRNWLDDAQARLSSGLLSEAEHLIQQSLELRPQSLEAQALQRDLKERRREQERALERARAVRSAVTRARASLDEGALEAAVRSASEALAYDPDDNEARMLKSRATAALAERQRLREHERLAFDAVAEARHRAIHGDLQGAMGLLQAFDPPHEIVDGAIKELQAEIETAQRRRREEGEARQRRASEEEERRLETERVSRELEEVRKKHDEEERRRREAELRRRQELSRRSKAEARDALERGEFGPAQAALERVRGATPEDSDIDGLIQALEERRADAEAAARLRLTFERSLADATACLEQEEYSSALRLVDAAIDLVPTDPGAGELRQRIRSSLERHRREEEIKRQADAVAAKARRLFISGDFAAALRLLDEFPEKDLVAPVVAELRTEQRRLDEGHQADEARRRDQEAARTAEETRRRAEADAQAREETARQRAEEQRRQATEAASRAAEAQRRADVERQQADGSRSRQAPTPKPSARPWMPWLVVTLVLSVGAVALWYSMPHGTKAPVTGGAGDAGPPRGDGNTHGRSANEILAEVKRLYPRDPRTAIRTAVESYRSSSDPGLQQFLSNARETAAKATKVALDEAQSSDAARQGSFAEAAGKVEEANKLTGPLDTTHAIELYGEAEELYRRAATEALNDSTMIVRKAVALYGRGNVEAAIQYAIRANTLDSKHRAGLGVIDKIRSDAAQRAAAARGEALKATASDTVEFREAEAKVQDARGRTGAENTLDQVRAYRNAELLYGAAAEASRKAHEAAHSAAEKHVADAQTFINNGNLDKVVSEIDAALGLEAGNAAALALKSQIDARRDLAARALNERIAALMEQAKSTADHMKAVGLLEEAYKLDRSRDDVRRELDRRRNTAPGLTTGPTTPGPTGSSSKHDQELAAIQNTIGQYKAAYESRDAGALVRIAPFLKSSERGLEKDFKQSNSYRLDIQEEPPEIDLTTVTASVRCTITTTVDQKVGNNRSPEPRKAVIHLSKTSGVWLIVNIVYPR